MLRIGAVLSYGVTWDERCRCCGWREPGEEGTGMALRTPAWGSSAVRGSGAGPADGHGGPVTAGGTRG